VAGSAVPAPASVNGQEVTWNLSTVAVHDQPTITFRALAGADLQNGTGLHNCASVTWSDMLGNLQGVQPSSCADTTAVNEPPVLVLPGDQTVDFHDPISFTISATDAEATDVLTFAASGLPAGLVLTDNGNRTATVSGSPAAVPATYLVTFSVSDAHNPPVTGTLHVTVTREETTTAYTGPAVVANGEPSTLSAVLKEDGSVPIAGRTLTLALGSGGSAQTCSGQTDATGTARCTIASVSQPLNATATLPVTATFAGDAFYLPSTGTATVRLRFMTGRSFGLSADVSALIVHTSVPPTPDTGQVRTASATTTNTPCTATVRAAVVTAHSLCANVTTTLAPGTSTATASLTDATIGVAGLPVIAVSAIKSTSHSECGSATGTVTLKVTIGGVPITTSLAPNTVIDLGVARLVINEQKPVPGADFGLTVNAVHLVISGIVANGDVILGSATSDIHNCA
jgi:hypothetical protein